MVAGRGEVNAAVGQVVEVHAGDELAVGDSLGDVLRSNVNALHGGGDDVVGSKDALVGVDADGPDAFLVAGLDDAHAGAAGSVVDDVGALGDHVLRSGGAAGGVTKVVGVVLQNGGVGADGQNTGDEAHAELVHGREHHALNIADGLALGDGAGDQADEVGGLLLGEHQAGDVRQIGAGVVVDDGELLIGVGLGGGAGGVGEHVADRDDQVVLLIDEGVDVGLVVSVGLGLEVVDFETAVFLGESLQAFPGGLVEGLVVDAADVGDHTDLDLGAGSGSSRLAAGAEGEDHAQREDECENLFHVCSSIAFFVLSHRRALTRRRVLYHARGE